jgi:transcription termination factor Rho
MDKLSTLEAEVSSLKKFWSSLKLQIEKDMKLMSASGGGAASVLQLDFPVRTVTSNYTINRHDYYIGVNHTEVIGITLSNPFPGRKIVIKDETGYAQLVPINIIGVVDNDAEGAQLRINNGALTLIYNNGWRVI